MTAAARQLNIAPSTLLRWLNACNSTSLRNNRSSDFGMFYTAFLTRVYAPLFYNFRHQKSSYPSSGSKSDKISAWAQANANPSPVVQRSASRSAPSSTYAPSNFGGGSMKRKLTRRNTRRLTAAPSMYNEDEEEER